MNDINEFPIKALLCFIMLSFVVVNWFNRNFKRVFYKRPPKFPGALPIIGHTMTFLRYGKDLWAMFRHIMDYTLERGDHIFTLVWGNYAMHISGHPAVSNILANKCLDKHHAYTLGNPWFGEGLITSKAAVWKRHRKLISPAMNQQILNEFLLIFNQQSKELVTILKDKAGKGLFDHLRLIRQNTMITVSSTIMGYQANTDIAKQHLEFIAKFELLAKSILERMRKPWLINELLYKCSGLKKYQAELAATLNKLIDKISAEKEFEMKNETNDKNDKKFKTVLELLLELKLTNLLTHQEVKDETNTMFAAAYDTSSLSTGQIMILLGSYPDVHEAVYRELHAVFGGSDRDVTKEDLSQLKYLDAVVKETLRLYPTIPLVLREVDKDINIEEYTLPAGDGIAISLYDLNRHPETWGPDADSFRPERWLEPNSVSEKSFAAFSIGRRNCIGMNFAMMNLKTTLAHVLRRYKITADISKVKYEILFTLWPISGHHITLEER